MRVILGFVTAAELVAALAQPASAVCIYRAGATMCYDDPKHEKAPGASKTLTVEYADPPADAPSDLKTIVMQPNASDGNAWVMKPGDADGATAPSLVDVAVPACLPGTNC